MESEEEKTLVFTPPLVWGSGPMISEDYSAPIGLKYSLTDLDILRCCMNFTE